jgi:hypothetical protein
MVSNTGRIRIMDNGLKNNSWAYIQLKSRPMLPGDSQSFNTLFYRQLLYGQRNRSLPPVPSASFSGMYINADRIASNFAACLTSETSGRDVA